MALTRKREDSMPKKAAKAMAATAATTLPPKAAKAGGRFAKKRWSDMSTTQHTAVVAAGVVQVSMAAAAWIDLARRPTQQVRGPKALWAVVIAVNFVGPAVYFAVGRTPGPAPSSEGGGDEVDRSEPGEERELTGS